MRRASIDQMRPYVHLFFMDGVGLSGPDDATNPFSQARHAGA